MKMSIVCLFATSVAVAGFGPNVRIDHQYLSRHVLVKPAIAVGPGTPSGQPLYVAFEDDTLPGGRSDVWFQKSLDGGRTWLPTDLLIRRGERYASDPDITTDSDGNVAYIYTHVSFDTAGTRHYQILCVRSSDSGTTWTAPSRIEDNSGGGIGWARIAADSAGNLFAAWNQLPGGISRIFSSVSTDRGATWSPRVRVDDDTTDEGCYHVEVFVQPGTNHYLVAVSGYRWVGGHINPCVFLYRSTDRGLTFQPGVQLDTFNWAAGSPHVVADRDHIICDYFGESRNARGRMLVEARTFYTQADTWGTPSPVINLDSLHRPYYSGALALSADGRVHTTLMICDTAEWLYHVYYTSSADHGVSWSDLELVDEDTTLSSAYPDIGADSAGYVYAVWSHGDDGEFRIWFATDNPAGISESPKPQAPSITLTAEPSIFSRTTTIRMSGSSLITHHSSLSIFDASGRLVCSLPLPLSPAPRPYSLVWDGRDASGSRCPAGLYIVRYGTATAKVTLLPAE